MKYILKVSTGSIKYKLHTETYLGLIVNIKYSPWYNIALQLVNIQLSKILLVFNPHFIIFFYLKSCQLFLHLTIQRLDLFWSLNNEKG